MIPQRTTISTNSTIDRNIARHNSSFKTIVWKISNSRTVERTVDSLRFRPFTIEIAIVSSVRIPEGPSLRYPRREATTTLDGNQFEQGLTRDDRIKEKREEIEIKIPKKKKQTQPRGGKREKIVETAGRRFAFSAGNANGPIFRGKSVFARPAHRGGTRAPANQILMHAVVT